MKSICYLRSGRKLRASGYIVDPNGPKGTVKVKPERPDWNHVWLTKQEIENGKEKPPYQPREKRDDKKPRKARAPKAAPLPRWKQLVAEVRFIELADTANPSFPDTKVSFLKELADELEAAHARLAEFLPLGGS